MPGALNLGDRGFAKKSEKGCPITKNNMQAKLLLNEYLNNYNRETRQKEDLA
jgi:hypothetical protein